MNTNRRIIWNIWIPHDEARMAYRYKSNIVGTIEEFTRVVADYYNYHYTRCVTGGGQLPPSYAEGEAKEIIDKNCNIPRTVVNSFKVINY